MADNYLEKRMEDYRRGRTQSQRTVGPRAGRLTMPYPRQCVLVDGADTPAGRAAVETFVAAGCTVVFTAAGDNAAGQRLAQALGGRYYSMPPDGIEADMARRGESLGAVIWTHRPDAILPGTCNILLDTTATADPLPGAIVISGSAASAAQAARLALMCAYPGAAMPPQLIRL